MVDSSTVISELISYARRGRSLLCDIVKEPFLELYGPPKLIAEVEGKIPIKARKYRLKEADLYHAWRECILPSIKITDSEESMPVLMGWSIVGGRDPQDVPFVALTIATNAHGIITKDKDIIEQTEVRSWKLDEAVKTITVFKKGCLSFFISSKFLPAIFNAVFQIVLSILRGIYKLSTKILGFFVNIFHRLIRALSQLPDPVKAVAIVIAFLLLTSREVRAQLVTFLRAVLGAIADCLSTLYENCKYLLEQIAPVIDIGISILYILFSYMNQAIDELHSLYSGRFSPNTSISDNEIGIEYYCDLLQ